MVNVLSNGVSFLDIARGPFQNNGIGLSPNARRLTESFLNDSRTLFNTLYLSTEEQEASLVTQIAGLRSRLGVVGNPFAKDSETDTVPTSNTRGRSVNTRA